MSTELIDTPDKNSPYILRMAEEGIPVAVISRVMQMPFEDVHNVLEEQAEMGFLIEIPCSDWPPTGKNADRVPATTRKPTDDDLLFLCRKNFALTNLEAAFLVLLMKHERADKEKLHHVIETQRLRRSAQPDNRELTDPKMVDVMICKLRKKLKCYSDSFKITTVWGGGYYIEPEAKREINGSLYPETTGKNTE